MWWISVESINKRCRYGAIIPKFGQIHPRVLQYDLLIFEHVVQAAKSLSLYDLCSTCTNWICNTSFWVNSKLNACTDHYDNATDDNDSYSGDNGLPFVKVGRGKCLSLFIYRDHFRNYFWVLAIHSNGWTHP